MKSLFAAFVLFIFMLVLCDFFVLLPFLGEYRLIIDDNGKANVQIPLRCSGSGTGVIEVTSVR